MENNRGGFKTRPYTVRFALFAGPGLSQEQRRQKNPLAGYPYQGIFRSQQRQGGCDA